MKHIFIVVLLCCLGIGLHGQTQKEAGITVSGVVLDETKLPIPGANVYLKDRAGVGTVTDMDGKFSLKGAEENDVLVVSFLGYEKESIRVGKKTAMQNLQVNLRPSENTLDETVVVGLGSQRKVSLVGAVTTVDVKDLQVPATSIPICWAAACRVSFRCRPVASRERTSRTSGFAASARSEPTKVLWC